MAPKYTDFSTLPPPEDKIENIIKALDFLRNEARTSGNEDIYQLIDSTFNICLQSYCIIKRYEMENFFKKDLTKN